jgi:hypothetical protein
MGCLCNAYLNAEFEDCGRIVHLDVFQLSGSGLSHKHQASILKTVVYDYVSGFVVHIIVYFYVFPIQPEIRNVNYQMSINHFNKKT